MAAPTVGLHLNFRGYVTELLARIPIHFSGKPLQARALESINHARWVRARDRLALNDLIARTQSHFEVFLAHLCTGFSHPFSTTR